MQIGASLQLETLLAHPYDKQTFRSKIIEKNEQYIFIDYPFDELSKRTNYFPRHARFIVTYIDKDQSIYQFKTYIAGKANLPIPALALMMPAPEEIERIQRRQYVRIETAVDVAVHSIGGNFAPFSTVTADISAGGLSLIVPEDNEIPHKDALDICLVIPMDGANPHYIYAKGEHVRSYEQSVPLASIKFTAIHRQDKQRIIRYCFQKQRDARRKEMGNT
ncbi:hypothetical protein DX933_10790 [Ornithinibacillus gellani]|uniref:flagellar brake protein n=1 Tax=Ornithinibacillus gellani TaxID=2293253 RepID=UPI000F47754F|nr:flagellar brake domain-containing protein [Ornithinibacillus gellani]TQS74429.1 hypothetical protein DX933_10790 [Ornithinibacillus gellani]